MTNPYITIDLDKIEHNTNTLVNLCREQGIQVAGVTKGTCGHPAVARAMLRGGVTALADSRLENIQRLRAAGIKAPFILLRLPSLSSVEEVVESVEISLNSELSVLAALSAAALNSQRVHQVILMVDLGDLREGICLPELFAFVAEAVKFPGIHIKGVGANLACLSGVVPTAQNMAQLVAMAQGLRKAFGLSLEWISGINSSGLELIAAKRMPAGVNHARIGEAILLGRETIQRRSWPDTFQDAFVLHAEVLELKRKPSRPLGELGQDAFGGHPTFAETGEMVRALLNVGREDLDPDGIQFLEPGFRVVGASSGYLVVDVTQTALTQTTLTQTSRPIQVGDELAFTLNYSALLTAMTSPYVKKCPFGSDHASEEE